MDKEYNELKEIIDSIFVTAKLIDKYRAEQVLGNTNSKMYTVVYKSAMNITLLIVLSESSLETRYESHNTTIFSKLDSHQSKLDHLQSLLHKL